jgi:hypothetical protein
MCKVFKVCCLVLAFGVSSRGFSTVPGFEFPQTKEARQAANATLLKAKDKSFKPHQEQSRQTYFLGEMGAAIEHCSKNLSGNNRRFKIF